MSFIYLASPYSHEDPLIREMRYLLAAKVTADLLQKGVTVYCPIVHCHELAKIWDMPKGFDFWMRHDYMMIAAAAELRVIRIDGWNVSKDVAAEVAYAQRLHIPVKYI